MSEYKILPMDEVDYGDTYADPLRPEIYQEVGLVTRDAMFITAYDIGWWDSMNNAWYQWVDGKLSRRKIQKKIICWFKLVPWNEI